MSISHPGVRSSYARIAASLKNQIAGGELPVNSQLPPIQELAARFGTTAITVRRALRTLEEEGLIRVEHGVGTFVADWPRDYDLLHLPSFAAEMAAKALDSETEVLGRGIGSRRPEAAEALGLDSAARVVILTRLRRVEGRPVALQRSYLPESLLELVRDYSPRRSLYQMLRERTGRAPAAAEERLCAILLPEVVAEELGQKAGAAGWKALRTTFDAADKPLLYDEAFFAGAHVELAVYRRTNQTLLEYRLKPDGGSGDPETG